MLDLTPIKKRCEKARELLARKRGQHITPFTFAVTLCDATGDIAALITEVERLRAENEQHITFERQVSNELDRMIENAKTALEKRQ